MRFEEILQSIQDYINRYELEKNIRTLNIECRIKKDNWAIFGATKTDNSQTLFFARKGKRAEEDNWNWWCPSESEVEVGFPLFVDIYDIINMKNKNQRNK